ncbi:hypothetical protein HAX54_046852, partial [Datura stramonium]|nr:hypothetical protein [Datura stramonium]
WKNQVVDVTKSYDDMNPKIKKRKKEPTISHPPEVTMSPNIQLIDAPPAETRPSSSATPVVPQLAQSISAAWIIQVANITAQNNTRLTSLIELIPDMIKRAIEKALATIYNTVKDLEKRQLQPDLSIFDAPLMEDEALEDKREERDENSPSSHAPAGEEAEIAAMTMKTATTTQSKEAEDG